MRLRGPDLLSDWVTADRLLLNRRSLETCPLEVRQSLAYVLHLRSYWKPQGRAKLIVPTSWMVGSCYFDARGLAKYRAHYKEFIPSFADGKCGMGCVVNIYCPFHNVRFESGVAEARLVVPDEELPRDIISQLSTNLGMEDCLATFVPRAFKGIPRTSLRRYAHQ